MTRVLVVDDEPQFRRAVTLNLNARGYDVDVAASGEEALKRAATSHPDVVLLDLGLPDIDGTDVVRGLRRWSTVPVIIVSARDAEAAKVAALDAGADDYLTKPFGMDELLARLRAALRRPNPGTREAVIRTPDFTIDLTRAKAWRLGEEVHLTPTEWQLVSLLMRNPGRLLTQRWLVQQIWGRDKSNEPNYLRVYLAGLRRKLERDPSRPRYFITESGMGYRFEHSPDDESTHAGPDGSGHEQRA